MPTADGFTPDHSLPHFLAERADQPRQHDIGKASDKAVIWPRILKTSIVAITAAAIGIAILSAGNPVTLFADVKASLIDSPALQPQARSAGARNSTDRRCPGFAAGWRRHADPRRTCGDFGTRGQESDRNQRVSIRRFVEKIRGLGGQGKLAGTGWARTARPGCPGTGRGKRTRSCPSYPKAAKGPARIQRSGADPVRAESPSKDPAAAKCTGTSPARTGCPSTGIVRTHTA